MKKVTIILMILLIFGISAYAETGSKATSKARWAKVR